MQSPSGRRPALVLLALLLPAILGETPHARQASAQCSPTGEGHRQTPSPGCTSTTGAPLQGAGLLTPANFSITGPSAGSYSILAVDTLTGNNAPAGVAFNPNNGYVYVTDSSGGCHVTVLNPGTGGVVTTVNSGTAICGFTSGVAVNPATNHVYFAQPGCGANYLIDVNGATNTVAGPILLNAADCNFLISQVAVNRQTNRIYAGENDCNTGTAGGVFAVDGATLAVTKINIPASLGTVVGVAVNEVANKVYATNNFCGSSNPPGNKLTMIDGGSNTVLSSTGTSNSPGGVSFDAGTGTVVVTTGANFIDPGTVALFRGDSLAPAGSIGFAKGMNNVRVGAGRLYATSVGGNFLAAINPGSGLEATITGPPNTLLANLDVDCATGRVFVSLRNARQLLIVQGPAGGGGCSLGTVCNPSRLPAGGTTFCTFTLTGPMAGGTKFAAQITGPPGAIVSGCSSPPGSTLVCGPFSGNSGRVACASASGCPAGDSFTLSITSPNPGPLAGTVTISPPSGGAQSFQFDGVIFTAPAPPAGPAKVCSPSSVSIAAGGVTSCTITLGIAVPQGTRIIDQVTAPAGATITGCSAAAGGPLACGPTGSTSATLSCVAAGGCPAGATFALTIQSRSPGTFSETVTIASPSGTQTFPLSGQAMFG